MIRREVTVVHGLFKLQNGFSLERDSCRYSAWVTYTGRRKKPRKEPQGP